MVNVFQTDNKEASIVALSETNHTVLMYWRYRCIRPIRINWKELPDTHTHMHMYRTWKPEELPILETWRRKGGVLRYTPHQKSYAPPTVASDAMMFIECPLQFPSFEAASRDVTHDVVIYRPPTWELHNETIDYLYPPKETYIILHAIFDAMRDAPLSEEQAGCKAMAGYTRAAVFTAWDIECLTGWSEKYLKLALFPFMYSHARMHIYSTRIPPEDPDMLWAYNVLRDQFQIAKGQYALKRNYPRGGRILGFEVMLKRLIRECYVVREDAIYVFNLDYKRLDLDRLEALNNMHRGRWFKMKSYVDNLPEHDYET